MATAYETERLVRIAANAAVMQRLTGDAKKNCR